MKIDIKKIAPLITKIFLSIAGAILLLWLLVFSGITNKLLIDKVPKSSINEGEYILNKLADDYEKFLKARGDALDKENQFLLSEQGIAKTFNEKREIERKLKANEAEKKALAEEYQKSLQRRAEIEASISGIKNELETSSKEMAKLNERYKNLISEKEKSDSYWKSYVNDLLTFFKIRSGEDQNKINEKFRNDNGGQYIADEYSDLQKKVDNQRFEISQNKIKENKIIEETKSLEQQIKEFEKTNEYYTKYADVIQKFQNIFANFNNASLYYKQKNFIKSSAEYKKVINELDEIRGSYEGLLQIEKDLQNEVAKKYMEKGVNLMNERKYNDAVDAFAAIINTAPVSDFTSEALSKIFDIKYQYADKDKLGKENIAAKLILDKANAEFKAKKYNNALKLYYSIIIEHPISDYRKEALSKSNQIKEITINNKLTDFSGEMKRSFTNDYKTFEKYYNSGDYEKARNYYFDALDKTFGYYSNYSIFKFKEFEDKYIDVLLKNYENQLKSLNISIELSNNNEKAPSYIVLKTTTLKSDGIAGKDAYTLIREIFGKSSLVSPDTEGIHQGLKHITKGVDAEVGNYFKMIIHRDSDKFINNENKAKNNIMIRTDTNSTKDILAFKGEALKYSWKIKINNDIKASKETTALFSIYPSPNNIENLSKSLITLGIVKKNNKDFMTVNYSTPDEKSSVIAYADWNKVKGKWLIADCIISFRDDGFIYFALKELNGSTILSVNKENIPAWRNKTDFFRANWEISRMLDDINNINSGEDSVFIADILIQKIKLSNVKENKDLKAEIEKAEKEKLDKERAQARENESNTKAVAIVKTEKKFIVESKVIKSITLKAEGQNKNTTLNILKIFGMNSIISPDSIHKSVKHITAGFDNEVGNFFKLTSHRALDGRPARTVITLVDPPSYNLIAGRGKTISYKWKFKIARSTLRGNEHIDFFNINAFTNPVSTSVSGGANLSAKRESSSFNLLDFNLSKNTFQIRKQNSKNTPPLILSEIDSNKILGKWMQAETTLKFDDDGYYNITIKDLSGNVLMSCERNLVKMVYDTPFDLFYPTWGLFSNNTSNAALDSEDELDMADFSADTLITTINYK